MASYPLHLMNLATRMPPAQQRWDVGDFPVLNGTQGPPVQPRKIEFWGEEWSPLRSYAQKSGTSSTTARALSS